MKEMTSLHEAQKSRQAKAALHHSDSNPSEITDIYWIYAIRRNGSYPSATDQSGKWLVFVPASQIDEVWVGIKKATEEGRLGGSSKVSTSKPNPNATDSNIRVICVYTYDWTNEEDVNRVRDELRALGITRKIPYKADKDTLNGKYRIAGDTKISKRYE